jgi:hypothetical protein
MSWTTEIEKALSQEEYAALLVKSKGGFTHQERDELIILLIRAKRKIRRLEKRVVKLTREADELLLSKRVVSHAIRDLYYVQEHKLKDWEAKYVELAYKYHDLQKERADEQRARDSTTETPG